MYEWIVTVVKFLLCRRILSSQSDKQGAESAYVGASAGGEAMVQNSCNKNNGAGQQRVAERVACFKELVDGVVHGNGVLLIEIECDDKFHEIADECFLYFFRHSGELRSSNGGKRE